MKLREIIRYIEGVFYTCPHCRHQELISVVACPHCQQPHSIFVDFTKKYPVICEHCLDKGLYVNCSKCQQVLFSNTFKHDIKHLGFFFILSLCFIAGNLLMFWLI